MPELRQEPITGNWVIIATERSKRPSDFPVPQENSKGGACPFCRGSEKLTPPEITACREPGTRPDEPGWRIRVVPNKYPALESCTQDPVIRRGFFTSMYGAGAHEVIVESPEHDKTLEQHDLVQLQEIFRAWRDRHDALLNTKPIRYVQIFKNEGAVAGASLRHPHSQVIATPLISGVIEQEIGGAGAIFIEKGGCPYCEMIAEEVAAGDRLIAANQQFIAICPFASRFPFEMLILPKQHQASYSGLEESMIGDLSSIVKEAMQKLNASLRHPPYNMMLHTAPAGFEDAPYYHWHLEILPRLTAVAGFEWGTGFYINPTAPESAAEYLRKAIIH